MAQDRSGDIARIEIDLDRLHSAQHLIENMLKYDNNLSEKLTALANTYVFSAEIPQNDFQLKMEALNENIGPSLSSISRKISDLIDELNELLEKYRAEQEEWEEEQRRANDNNNEVQVG